MIDLNNVLPIDRLANPSVKVFKEKYMHGSMPAVLSGIMDEWPATPLWTLDYISSNFGRLKAYGHRFSAQEDWKEFTVSEYINYAKTCDEEHPYYLTDCQFHRNTQLMTHFKAPAYFNNWLDSLPSEQHPFLSWIYLGAKNTHSPMHLDIWNTSAWNAVFFGKKAWLFFPPGQDDFLYNGLVNPFVPDYDKYPYFKKATALYCIQEKGDIVFTPSGWWHAVVNLEGGISITENFINETNFQAVNNTFRQKKMFKHMDMLNDFIRNNKKY